MNPLRDCHLRTHQTLREHTRIFARAYYLRPNNASHLAVRRTMCHAGTKSARPSVAPLFEPQWGLTLIEPPRPYYLGQKKQERREEAVNSTDFSHSSRKAWRTINKLTGRSGRSFHQCPVSANSIATQLVKNGAHRTGDRESTRLVNKELSDRWKIPTPEGQSISEPFRPEELAAAFRRLKPGKSLGLDSIFPEFILHAGSALKSWFCDFLTSCMHQLKIPKIWRRALIVAIPKPEKPSGDPRAIVPYLCCVFPLKSSRDSSHRRSCRPSHRHTAPSGAGGLSTREVDCKPGHPADVRHRG